MQSAYDCGDRGGVARLMGKRHDSERELEKENRDGKECNEGI